jgi:hypothetical protein
MSQFHEVFDPILARHTKDLIHAAIAATTRSELGESVVHAAIEELDRLLIAIEAKDSLGAQEADAVRTLMETDPPAAAESFLSAGFFATMLLAIPTREKNGDMKSAPSPSTTKDIVNEIVTGMKRAVEEAQW